MLKKSFLSQINIKNYMKYYNKKLYLIEQKFLLKKKRKK